MMGGEGAIWEEENSTFYLFSIFNEVRACINPSVLGEEEMGKDMGRNYKKVKVNSQEMQKYEEKSDSGEVKLRVDGWKMEVEQMKGRKKKRWKLAQDEGRQRGVVDDWQGSTGDETQ